jgi:type II secretory pathway pseudopilin PulG
MRTGDRGESLLELLVAVAILGTAVVAVLGGLATGIRMSGLHREQATAGVAVRAYAEAIQNSIASNGYVSCAGESAYAAPAGYTAPTGYTASVVAQSMRYWSGTAWQTTCTTDQGLQQLTIQVASPQQGAAERLVVTVRRPCGPTEAVCV